MKKSYGRNVVFFIILILLTFFFLIRGQNLNYMFKSVTHIRWEYTFIGLSIMSIYLIAQSCNTKMILKNFGYNINIFRALKYTCIEYFYSAITPSSTGGQPMEIYYMNKDGINISHSTVMVLLELCSHQIIALLFLTLGLIFNYDYLIKNLDFFKVFLIYGIIITVLYITLLIILLFSKKSTKVIRKIAAFILNKFRIKNREAILKKLDSETIKYQECSDYIKTHKSLIPKILGINFIQILAAYSVTYITTRALHLHVSYIQVITLQGVLYTSVACVPIPGTIGINEVGFGQLFLPIFKEKFISLATVLNRFMNFYFYVILSGIVTVVNHVKPLNIDLERTTSIKKVK